MVTALYPGKFDPVTMGHVDIAARASSLFDEVVIGVAYSRSTIFTLDERMAFFQNATDEKKLTNIRVTPIEGLTVDSARSVGAAAIVRGLRTGDFGYEFDMALMNRHMAPDIESIYLMTSLETLFVSSTRIRELAGFGRDVSDFVTEQVAIAISEKFNNK
ncbi:MAG TPA: pantetheine-phosphate adenylyltransferase [Dehalococcoidia bacterium]|jgi:pantetheine-phosphate adenylyltransferase|nr:pantetheine-phosphate adenylyltransferase [Dehalococcoidia bacterium]